MLLMDLLIFLLSLLLWYERRGERRVEKEGRREIEEGGKKREEREQRGKSMGGEEGKEG